MQGDTSQIHIQKSFTTVPAFVRESVDLRKETPMMRHEMGIQILRLRSVRRTSDILFAYETCKYRNRISAMRFEF
jgi:hypothetical protein